MREVVPETHVDDQGWADRRRRVTVGLIQLHGSRTALKVYLAFGLGLFTSVIVIASVLQGHH